MRSTFRICLLAIALITTSAWAQPYPSKPVRIFTTGAGSGSDFIARLIAQQIAPILGQPVVIENRSGPGSIGGEIVAKSPPDGHTLLIAGGSFYSVTLLQKMPYDTLRDFAPISLCVKGANVLAVHPSLPVKTVKELIALAKTKPGKLNYASSGLGSSNQMAGELFKLMAGVNIVHVPYKGNSPALTDTIAGQVEMIFSGVPLLVPHIEAGRIRAIGIGSAKRFVALPNVPTIDESGLKGYEATTWFGLLAPVKVPKDIVARLNVEVGRILASNDVSTRFINEGVEPIGGTPEFFTAFIRDEIAKYAKVVKAANLKGE